MSLDPVSTNDGYQGSNTGTDPKSTDTAGTLSSSGDKVSTNDGYIASNVSTDPKSTAS